MDKCKNCGVEIIRNTGRRPKEFCSDSCRVKFWQKNKKKKSPNPEPEKKEEKTEPANNNLQTSDVKVEVRPKNLEELKAMCPPELTGLDKSAWVATKRQEYGI